MYQNKQRRKYQDLKQSYDAKEEVMKRLVDRVQQLEDQLGSERKTVQETQDALIRHHVVNPPISEPMARASSLLRRHLSPSRRGSSGMRERSDSKKRVMFNLDEQQQKSPSRASSQQRESAIFAVNEQNYLEGTQRSEINESLVA